MRFLIYGGSLDFGGEKGLGSDLPNLFMCFPWLILIGDAPTRKAGLLAPPNTMLKKTYPVPAEIDEMIVTLYDTECRRDKNLNTGEDNFMQANLFGLIINRDSLWHRLWTFV